LLPFTNDDIALKQSKGMVQKWEAVLHDSSLTFVDELVKENENFFELPFEKQKEMLINKAKAIVNTIDGRVAIDSMNVVGGIMDASTAKAESIMQSDVASEEELKAQAQLKGSVGGVQGILELQRAVASGESDRDAAVSILELVYGFTRKEAEDIIGNPKQVIPISGDVTQQ
jgi:isopenicillin N synthase-like dioxygenase